MEDRIDGGGGTVSRDAESSRQGGQVQDHPAERAHTLPTRTDGR